MYYQAFGTFSSDGEMIGQPTHWKIFDENDRPLCTCDKEEDAIRIYSALATEETKAY